MPEACSQCAGLEHQLSDIKSEIAEEIGRGRSPRSTTNCHAKRRSLAELLASLIEIQGSYERHRRDDHVGGFGP